MTVRGHVFDRADFDAWCVHRHDNFADAFVWRAVTARSADEIAVVSEFSEACPNFLAVDHELVAVAGCECLQRSEVAARVWFAHADAPSCFARQHLWQKRILLGFSAVANECRTHLSISEPRRSNWRASTDHFFADD